MNLPATGFDVLAMDPYYFGSCPCASVETPRRHGLVRRVAHCRRSARPSSMRSPSRTAEGRELHVLLEPSPGA